MNTSKTNEQAFEALIEKALVGSTHEERSASGQNDVEAQSPNAQQYYWGQPNDFDKKWAIDLRRLWAFLEASQKETLSEYKGKDLKTELPKRIAKDIETFGIIKVLREGVEVDNIKLSLFYPKPSAADSEASKRKYAQNQFSLTRQQTFSVANPGLEIDMVLFVNGLPVFTFELKNPWTHQTAKYDGQKQYKSVERNPKETLLNFGRCLAHFTMDKDEVFFTTRLNLDKTYFMPFNKGMPNGQGAGNPVSAEGGFKTSYMWEQILQKDTVAFGQSAKIVAHADTSKDLNEAIENNKRIIITTIQKFPFICDAISDVSDHNFAIIIDEAHSSQSGIAADKLNATVQKDADTDCSDTDALLDKLMKDRKMSTNCSYFAFTATPKRETLERFGSEDAEGKFHPYHLYSMKQAIEEGFILDVLTNYTTYRSYYELTKSIEDNPEYNNERAQKKLRGAVERDPKTIAAKAEVMLAHFDAKVFRSHKLKGKAKAMVVTKDIECAIKYYWALNRIIDEKSLPYKILIAFSGEKRMPSQTVSMTMPNVSTAAEAVSGYEYTEAGMNGFPDTQTAEKFDTDDYRILVVANKYLTGFDQPKLCAMYVDKPLDGVLAVQALSRLNRSAPDLGKLSEDLFILDFYNTQEGIKEAFDPFYTATTLSEATDVNILHELKNTLLSFGVFDMDEVYEFIDLYIHGASADQWSPIIDTAVDRFNIEIEWPENGKADFKMKCKQFVKIYSRVAAIMPFEMKDWEKLFWFLRYLIPSLHITNNGDDGLKDLLDSVDLNTYGLRRTALNETITLDSGEATINPLKPTMVNAGVVEEAKDPLDEILKEFNQRWFNGWDATPDDQKMKMISVAQAVAEDEEYKELVVGNPDQQAVDALMEQIIDRIIRKKRKGDMSLYKEYQQNEGFKVDFRNVITRMLGDLEYLQAR